MLGICVECSHQRGMGNLFRSLNIIRWIGENNLEFVLMINDDRNSLRYLDSKGIPYVIVDLWNYDSNWEMDLITQNNIDIWINDRMATDIRHARHVKEAGIKLCSIDDTGSGATLCDINFSPMVFENIEKLEGKRVLTGSKYMILNPEIEKYRKRRYKKENILITLGGSDTYSVTLMVAEAIKSMNYRFTIVTGYCFQDEEKLNNAISNTDIQVVNTVPSLIEYMSHFDLAITGGGITPFEAIAQGMPTIIVANEHHEEQVGRFFEKEGCAEYVGYYKDVKADDIVSALERADVNEMSEKCLNVIDLEGLDNVMEAVING